jgi:signal transduction histidine kinase
MKLARKMVFASLSVLLVIVAVHGLWDIRVSVEQYKEDASQQARLLGRVVAASVRDMGEDRAQSLIDDANAAEAQSPTHWLSLRWVWLDAPSGDDHAPRVPPDKLEPLRAGQEVVAGSSAPSWRDYRFSYVPVTVDSRRPTAVEVAQSLAPIRAYSKRAVTKILIVGALLIVVASLLTVFLGIRMVGYPIRTLVQGARRIGSGDLTGAITLGARHDELGDLGRELNAMLVQLRESREKLTAETAKRIEAIKQLQEAERLAAVGRLASGLAHELGTPLNVVSGRAKMLAVEELPTPEIIENATIIGEQAHRMTSIIRQLLDFARRGTPQKEPIDLGDLARRVTAILRPIAEKHNVTITCLPAACETTVAADVGHLEQVLMNLVMNAIQAMPRGGPAEVSMRRERMEPPADHGGPEGEYLCLTVTDRGEGISPENIDRIFTPFFSTKEAGKGTGLGLSIAYSIVRSHGGWISVQSEVGAGSRFSVYLPVGAQA